MGSCHTLPRPPTQRQIAQSPSPEPKVERGRHRHLAKASNLPSAPSLCPAFRFLCRFALDTLQMLGFIALFLFQPLGPAYSAAAPRAASEPGGAARRRRIAPALTEVHGEDIQNAGGCPERSHHSQKQGDQGRAEPSRMGSIVS